MTPPPSWFRFIRLDWSLAMVVALGGGAYGAPPRERPPKTPELIDAALASSAPEADPVVALVQDLTIQVPPRFNVPYPGHARAEFPSGLPLSVGSGLRLRHKGPRLSFYGLADRGPNGDAPAFLDAQGVSHPTKSFLAPGFTPQIVTIDVLPSAGPVVTSVLPIKANGVNVSGLGPTALTTEVALSETLAVLPAPKVGVDPEGIDIDARGNIWLGEEFGPSLLRVHPKTGEILTKLMPSAGLPAVLASRQVNRGFEGVAVAPGGKVYGLMQSTLDVEGRTKATAQFIRLVEVDPATGATRMFAYPHDVAQYAKSGDAKMGDIVAIDAHRFLVIEEGRNKDKALRNLLYEIDIAGATDLSGRTLAEGANAGKELEFGTAPELAAQVTTIRKSLLLDLRAYGWTDEKAEGLSLVDDKTIVVTNDQDFGVAATVAGGASSTDPIAYAVDANGALTIGGKASDGKYEIHAAPTAAQRVHMLVIRTKQPVTSYAPN